MVKGQASSGEMVSKDERGAKRPPQRKSDDKERGNAGEPKNLYQILQVDKRAESVVIHTAYVYLMNKYIADEERYAFKLAWEVLRDEHRRAQYDSSLPLPAKPDTAEPSLYQLLGVDQSAEPSIITFAYRYLAAMNDPENGGNAKTVRELKKAWKLLCDEKKRAAYDRKLSRT